MARRVWFKAKRYGWGWYPASWQGGLVLVAYLALTFWIFGFGSGADDPSTSSWVWFGGLTLALIYIGYKKGEQPRWRWGGK